MSRRVAIVLLALLAMGCDKDDNGGGRGAGGSPPAVVRTAVLAPTDWSDGLEAIGTARGRDSVTITAAVSETIERVEFESGQVVRAGDVLVRLSGREQRA